MLAIRYRSSSRLRLRTRLLNLVDAIGRWSNLDPFTVMVFAPMMQFGQLAHIDMGGGTLAFLMVVALSMLAAHVLGPRLMWDAADAGATRDNLNFAREPSLGLNT
jgi:paraquat-inducible protein A